MTASGFAAILIDRLGVIGIGIGVFFNGLGVPGLSEVLLPLGGLGIRQGHINVVAMFIVVMVCQIVGLSVAYWIARAGGLPLVERYGKYVFISHRDITSAERAFNKYGVRMIAVGAFVPGIQGFIGYAAGFAQMNYIRFILAAFIGKLVWVSCLMYLGWILGSHLEVLDRFIQQFGIFVLLIGVIVGIWYVRRHRQMKLAELNDTKRRVD
jgi:membrane protein DedA with SNARE-associated domain